MEYSSAHITNLKRALKNIKSKVIVDFVHMDQTGIIIVTNKVTFPLNLQIIEKYIKNANLIDTAKVDVSHISQSKSYLKIIDISYLLENTNTPISTDVVESIIKSNYIFNNIVVASKLYIIKVSPNSDMSIIWLDIWDVQSSNNNKELINRFFNIGSYITTIRDVNMNLEVP